MGIRLLSLSSGSRGNSLMVATDKTGIIIDAGIPLKHIEKGLKLLNVERFSVLVTHTHSDHINYLPYLSERYRDIEIYCHNDCISKIEKITQKKANIKPLKSDFYIEDITVSPFNVSHDICCVGYSFYHMGRKISIATDLGYVDKNVLESLNESDLLFLESNHDENLLLENKRYPAVLKRRILSRFGHLSNTDCANAILKINGVKQVVLGHLSEENNSPDLAFDTVCRILNQNGIVENRDLKISVALYNNLCGVFEVN